MSLNVVRYVNGVEIKAYDLSGYDIDNDVILRAIKSVNERMIKM